MNEQQFGIRWPTGSVFAYGSRQIAEAELERDGRGVGVLVVHDYEPGTSNSTEWREVPAAPVPVPGATQNDQKRSEEKPSWPTK